MEDSLRKVAEQRDSILNVLAFVRNPMTESIAMNSMLEGHPMKAVVHWNKSTMQVAVDPMTLPETAPDQKYVLWAIVDGKAVNEGNFEMKSTTGVMMMKTVEKADAFAISLEKSGDIAVAEGPVYVMGKKSPAQP